MFDWKKPTVEMLGRWQPWHDGHTELFKRALQKTGQVCIMYRDVAGVDAGVEGQSDNPFDFENPSVNTILGYRLGYELGKGISVIWDYRQFYRYTGALNEDGSGMLEPVIQTTVETSFSF